MRTPPRETQGKGEVGGGGGIVNTIIVLQINKLLSLHRLATTLKTSNYSARSPHFTAIASTDPRLLTSAQKPLATTHNFGNHQLFPEPLQQAVDHGAKMIPTFQGYLRWWLKGLQIQQYTVKHASRLNRRGDKLVQIRVLSIFVRTHRQTASREALRSSNRA